MTSAEITWIPASSSLTGGAFLLGFGRLCDLLGRKTVLLASLACLSALCIGVGFSTSGIGLDAVNGVIGVASAATIPAALGILGTVYGKPSKRKNYAFACFSAGNPLGFVVGMLIGGIATQIANWRTSYWVLSVVFAATTGVAAYSTPVDQSTKRSWSRETITRFDFFGIFLTIAGVGLLSAGLTEGSEASKGFATIYIIVLLVLGFLVLVSFVVWELYHPFPLVPMSVWRDRNFTLLNLILLLGFLAFPIALFWVALFFQRVRHFSPLMVAVHLLPAAISGTLINVIAGLILHRVSNKLLTGIGALAYTVAFILLALNQQDSSYWAFFMPGLTLMVVGADFQFNCCNMYIMSSRPASEQSVAGGILQTITKLCTTISFGVATAIFSAVQGPLTPPATSSTMQARASYSQSHNNRESLQPHGNGPLDTTQPYAAVFWYCAACAGVSLFLVPFLTIQTQGQGPVKEKVGEGDIETND